MNLEPPAATKREKEQERVEKRQEELEQRQRGRERRSLSAAAVHRAIEDEGREEMKRPSAALAWSGLAAGLSMGFSLVAEGLLLAHLPDAPWRPAVAKLGYSVGFVIVTMGRQQLYTENTLTAVLPVLMAPTARNVYLVVRLGAIVLAANLFGALLFAWVTAVTTAFPTEARQAFLELGVAAARFDFWSALIKGIYAGWLIAVMVWLMPAAEGAKFYVIVMVTYIVGLGELTHIVAGSAEVLYAVIEGHVSPGAYVFRYAIPTLIGNTLGGVLLVAALNHAQVVAGNE